jgi:hypothetical protein
LSVADAAVVFAADAAVEAAAVDVTDETVMA